MGAKAARGSVPMGAKAARGSVPVGGYEWEEMRYAEIHYVS